MIESLYVHPSARKRHLDGPMLKEREDYLLHLSLQGTSLERVRSVASIVCHATRLLNLAGPRKIDQTEIAIASSRWTTDKEFHKNVSAGIYSAYKFSSITEGWLRFHDLLIEHPAVHAPFHDEVTAFLKWMQFTRGLAPDSISSYKERLLLFQRWFLGREDRFEHISLQDVDAYLDAYRAEGWKPRTVGGSCQVLRGFFRFCEVQGWCKHNIAQGILSPRIQRSQSKSRGPAWKDVRRMLRPFVGSAPTELRAKAIVAICSIYGLRSSEVVRMRLDDFDWHSETLTICRSKRGRIQQFPIQHEVGEAILEYLKNGRPKCACRNLFVTWCAPFRPMRPSSIWQIVSRRMRHLKIESQNMGSHALRHACATQLLKNGSSLREIANFLGHRTLSSVRIYAKYDHRLLRQVSRFSLAGVR